MRWWYSSGTRRHDGVSGI